LEGFPERNGFQKRATNARTMTAAMGLEEAAMAAEFTAILKGIFETLLGEGTLVHEDPLIRGVAYVFLVYAVLLGICLMADVFVFIAESIHKSFPGEKTAFMPFSRLISPIDRVETAVTEFNHTVSRITGDAFLFLGTVLKTLISMRNRLSSEGRVEEVDGNGKPVTTERLTIPIKEVNKAAACFLDKKNMNNLRTLADETNENLKNLTEKQKLKELAAFMASK
jgi:hypothetical protein